MLPSFLKLDRKMAMVLKIIINKGTKETTVVKDINPSFHG
tara:strand:- start:983 stop:1102 length:120 start_codon:yes stop_codon:yes gene_type:complete